MRQQTFFVDNGSHMTDNQGDNAAAFPQGKVCSIGAKEVLQWN